MDRRKFIKTVGIAAGATLLSGMGIAGLPGNTHFPMSDLNNAEVAELMYD